MTRDYRDRLLAEFLAAGHKPIMLDSGAARILGQPGPDFMAYSVDDPESGSGHNGLECESCGFAICEWCWLRYGHKIDPCG